MPAKQFVVIDLVHGDYLRLLEERRVQEDRGIVTSIAPPWGAALDEVHGLDRLLTTSRSDFRRIRCSSRCRLMSRLACIHLNQIRMRLDWTDLRNYPINQKGRNHDVILGTKGWVPR